MDPEHTTPTGDGHNIQELAHEEWEQMRRERETRRALTETPGEDWDLARECWLRLEWRRRPPEHRYNQSEAEWAEIGLKVGVTDSELLQDWRITLEQAKREMPARLAGAFERCALSKQPKGGAVWTLTGSHRDGFYLTARDGTQAERLEPKQAQGVVDLAYLEHATLPSRDVVRLRDVLTGVQIEPDKSRKGGRAGGHYSAPALRDCLDNRTALKPSDA